MGKTVAVFLEMGTITELISLATEDHSSHPALATALLFSSNPLET